MKAGRYLLLTILIFCSSVYMTGCWNYRELDKLAIVAAAAIDKGDSKRFKLTVEIVDLTGERDSKEVSKTLTIEGNTIFDCARSEIASSGERLYWSHMKALIVSKKIAKEGIVEVLDWFARDSETRSDVSILISSADTAKEILQTQGAKEQIKGFNINDSLRNEKSLSKAPKIDVMDMIAALQSKGVSAIAPTVRLKKTNGNFSPTVLGTAFFKKDKLTGFLNEEETKALLFIRNEIKGGILIEFVAGGEHGVPISLEVFRSKTKVQPVINNGKIEFNISVETSTAIDEIGGDADVINDTGRKELEQKAEEQLKRNMLQLIKKMQADYNIDIFGFGVRLQQEKPKVWKNVKNNWMEEFKNVDINISAYIHIRNSSMLSKPLEVGE